MYKGCWVQMVGLSQHDCNLSPGRVWIQLVVLILLKPKKTQNMGDRVSFHHRSPHRGVLYMYTVLHVFMSQLSEYSFFFFF